MPVTGGVTRNDYIASDSQTVFAYTFKVLSASDLKVLKDGVELTVNNDYNVSNVGNENGGNVILTVGASSGSKLSILLAMPITRTTNYQNAGDFLASDVNADFDKAYLAMNQLETDIDRSIGLQDVEPSANLKLPLEADRANKILTFDASGDVTATTANYGGGESLAQTLAIGNQTGGNNVVFDDNDKSIFGDSLDLQIYHDASNSYVVDSGEGNLFIGGASYVDIGNGVVGVGGQTYARFNTAGSCDLKFNNVQKMSTTNTGIDVDGTVEFDGLKGTGAVTVTNILDEDNMASDSATALATQQSIKAYVDANAGGGGDFLPLTGGALTGAVTTTSTFDGRDVSVDGTKLDGIEAGATADQTAAEIKTAYESNADTNAFTNADETKLDGIEAGADVTDTTNVVASLSAGTGISLSAGGEIANTAPDQTVALTGGTGISTSGTYPNFTITNDSPDQIVALTGGGGTTVTGTYPSFTITSTGGGGGNETLAQTLVLGNVTGGTDISVSSGDNILMAANSTVDGRDVSVDGTKLDGIEAGADVTDTANVTAAGALMDSEVTNLAQVKAFDSADYATAAQGTTADAALPKAGGTLTGDLNLNDNVKANFGTSADLEIFHDGSNSYVGDYGTGNLFIGGTSYVDIGNGIDGVGGQTYARFNTSGSCDLKHNNVQKMSTTATGIDVSGNVALTGTVDGRDVSVDGAKLDGIEAGATADQTAAEIKTAYESNANTNAFTDADENKLDGIEAGADVTDTTNVVAALSAGTGITLSAGGEIANSAPDQTVALTGGTGISTSGTYPNFTITNDSPDQTVGLTGAGGTTITGTYPNFTITSTDVGGETLAQTLALGNQTSGNNIAFGDNDKALFGQSLDFQIYHDTLNSYVVDSGTGNLFIGGVAYVDIGNGVSGVGGQTYARFNQGAGCDLKHNNVQKMSTTSTGIDVTGNVALTGTVDGRDVATDGTKLDTIETNADVTDTANVTAAGALMTTGGTLTGDLDVTGTVTMDGLTVSLPSNAGNTLFYGGAQSDRGLEVEVSNADGFDNSAWKINAIAPNAGSTLTLATRDTDRVKLASNGDISFYEDTGTTAKLFWDASAEQLHVGGTTTPEAAGISIETTASTGGLQIISPTTGRGDIFFGDTADLNVGQIRYAHSDNSMTFRTNAADALTLDSSGNVGIGTSSPDTLLEVVGADPILTIRDTETSGASSNATLRLAESGASDTLNNYWDINHTGGSALRFVSKIGATTAERMHIDSLGNVGIGTDSPSSLLHASGVGATFTLQDTRGTGNTHTLRSSGTNGESLQLDSAQDLYLNADTQLFRSASEVERMRIDSSGNLLVGKTTSSIAVAGTVIEAIGRTWSSVDGGYVAGFNRLTSDGEILNFRKDGTTVGSIGADAGYLTIGKGDTGLLFQDGGDAIQPRDITGLANRDGAISLGVSGGRFKDLHLSGTANVGSIALGDNGKALFGAGDDLEIYHNGSNSYITDTGTGNLFVGGSSYVDIGNGVIGIGGQTYARFNVSGACQLNYNGVDKLKTISTGANITGSLGINTTSPQEELHVVGDIIATGNITAFFSDERLKDFQGTIPDALDKVNSLNGYYFTPNDTALGLGVEDKGVEVGISAQEVEAVLPEIVTDSAVGEGYKTVWYEKLTPLLIEAVKELTGKVDNLEARLKELEK